MQKQAKKQMKRPYLTLLAITAVVYFFLRFVWPLFAPLIVAFLVLVAVEPGLEKWSCRLGMKRKPLAYVFIVITIVGLLAGIWLGLIPFLQGCDFSWCQKLLKHPWIKSLFTYLQEHGLGTVAEWSTSALKIGSNLIFNIGAYGLSVFLLAGVFRKLKNSMKNHKEGILILGISQDIISYLKAYLLTQGKILLILTALSVLTLSVAGIENGWLLGILAGVLDFFPILGIGLVIIPTALWQFLEADYLTGAICVILFVVCAVLREILEPKFLGQAMKLPAIGIWISVYAGLQLFGVGGILKGPIAYLLICTIYRRMQWKAEEEP